MPTNKESQSSRRSSRTLVHQQSTDPSADRRQQDNQGLASTTEAETFGPGGHENASPGKAAKDEKAKSTGRSR